MIASFNDFNTTQAYTSIENLPRGGYVCNIVGARIDTLDDGTQIVRVAYDVAEGEHAGYFKRKFDMNTNEDKKWPGIYNLNVPRDDGSEQDGWTKRRFKTFTNALEDSNPGYHFDWDESKFKGKKIGIIINWREYDFKGNQGMTQNAAGSTSVDNIRNGNFKVPRDRMLKRDNAVQASDELAGFARLPADAEGELPF